MRLALRLALLTGTVLSMVFGGKHIVCKECTEDRLGATSLKGHGEHLSRERL